MYKYVLNSVVKISMMFAKYFEYYTIIGLLRGPFFRGHAVYHCDILSYRRFVFLILSLRSSASYICVGEKVHNHNLITNTRPSCSRAVRTCDVNVQRIHVLLVDS